MIDDSWTSDIYQPSGKLEEDFAKAKSYQLKE